MLEKANWSAILVKSIILNDLHLFFAYFYSIYQIYFKKSVQDENE